MVAVRQTSSAGGELAPNLYARPDLEKYAVGLARCHNAFISRQGQAVSRPGTESLGVTRLSPDRVGSGAARVSRLIPFIVSDSLAYVLEFGEQYVWVWKDGARVSPVSVSTPYLAADLPRLKFVQSGDVLELTLRGYAPATLTRNSETSWTYADMDFSRPGVQFANVSGRDSVFLDSVVYGGSAPDASHPGRPWKWCYTQLTRNSDGSLTESLPQAITKFGTVVSPYTQSPIGDGTIIAVYPDKPQKLSIGLRVNDVVSYRFYRGQGGLFGWIGDCDGYNFMDVGDAPDYTVTPPQGLNPMQVLNSDGTVASTETATTVSFFEDRLVFGGTDGRPTIVLGSASSDYYNFDSRLYPVESEAVNFTLAARKREEIRSLVPLTKLLCFTDAAVWAVGGAGGPLAFDSVDAKVQVEVGANWVDPVVIDGVALFARTKGTGLRALGFDFTKQAFSGSDMSLLASHLTEDNEIVAMAYCEDPWGVLWLLRDDGVLLSFTFVKDENVWAWAWHDFPGGKVLSICSIPENGEDVLYLVVDRGTGSHEQYNLERMKSRKLKPVINEDGTFAQQPWCLDSAVETVASGGEITPPSMYSVGGQSVMVLADGNVYGPYATDVTGTITDTVDPAILSSSRALWGVAYNAELETLDPIAPGKETRLVTKSVTRVLVETQDSFGFSAGQDFDHLIPYPGRQVSDGYGAQPQRSDAATLWMVGKGWGPKGHVCIRQSLPLPLTVLGITRDVTFGDP